MTVDRIVNKVTPRESVNNAGLLAELYAAVEKHKAFVADVYVPVEYMRGMYDYARDNMNYDDQNYILWGARIHVTKEGPVFAVSEGRHGATPMVWAFLKSSLQGEN